MDCNNTINYEDRLAAAIKKISEELSDKEIYLAGSAALYLQGIRYAKLPHDVDFCVISETETSKDYARYFSHCLKVSKLFIDIIARTKEFMDKNMVTTTIDFKGLSVPIVDVESCLNCKYEMMLRLPEDRTRKHFKQFKYLLETD